jgi:hypothetical protein
MSTASVPPSQQKKGNWLWWLLGVGGIAIVALIAGGMLVTGLVMKNVRVGEKNKQVQIHTPGGDLTLNATDKVKDVGLPIYPGAALVAAGGSIDITTPNNERVGGGAVHYRSSDSIQKVDAWYGARLGSEFKREGPQVRKAKVVVMSVEVNSDAITYTADQGDGARLVILEKTHEGVNIALLRFGKQEAQ